MRVIGLGAILLVCGDRCWGVAFLVVRGCEAWHGPVGSLSERWGAFERDGAPEHFGVP